MLILWFSLCTTQNGGVEAEILPASCSSKHTSCLMWAFFTGEALFIAQMCCPPAEPSTCELSSCSDALPKFPYGGNFSEVNKVRSHSNGLGHGPPPTARSMACLPISLGRDQLFQCSDFRV